MPPRATVVIVNYNGAHLLPACLDGLARQRVDGPDFETVVVDNASADGSLELLARDYPWARVIASDINLGFAGGNNLALREITTPYAVLLNNDAVPQPGWLQSLLDAFEAPGAENVGIVTGKIVFLPKFARLSLETAGFVPGPADTRELGLRAYSVLVDDADVSEKVIWGDAAYGPEGEGTGRFRWTKPGGDVLVPLPAELADDAGVLTTPTRISLRLAAERAKRATVRAEGQLLDIEVGETPETTELELPKGTQLVDVVNNAGSIVLVDGSGADRGFQEIDSGQYDEPAEVFAACGNGMAMRTAIGHEIGFFDDDFFMYYEDTDLSWRWRAQGWRIQYEPRAVLRHIHAASSKEWSPRFIYHVERNRLLMLTKNASRKLAGRAVASYLREFLYVVLHTTGAALKARRRPPVRQHLLRARIIRSYVRLAPRMLARRRAQLRTASVSPAALEEWLVTTR